MLDTPSKIESPAVIPSGSSNQNVLTAAKGSTINLFGLSFAYASRFVLGLIMARYMGAHEYGLYSLADTTGYVIIGLTFLGLIPALVRYVSIFVSRKDERSLRGTIQIGLGVPFVISLLASLGLLLFADTIAVSIFQEPELTPVLRVAALAIPFGALISTTVAATRGFKQMQYGVIAEDIFLSAIKLIIVIILAVLTGLTAVKAMSAHTIGVVAAAILLLYFLHRLFPLNRSWRSTRYNLKEMFKFSMPVYGSELLTLLGGNIQTLLLGALNTVMSVGVFTVAARVNLIGTIFYSAVEVAAQPIVSELHNKGEYKQLGHFYRSMTKWTFTSNLPIFLIILLFAEPILSIFGDDFVAGYLGLIILSCGSLVDAGTGINATMITMTGKTWLNIVNTLISLTSQLTLSLVLIPGLGMIGAAMAVAGSRSLLNIVRTVEVFIIYRLFPYDLSFIKPVIAGLLAALAAYSMVHWIFKENSLLGVVSTIAIMLIVYGSVILLLGLSAEDRMILNRLNNRLSHLTNFNKNNR